MKKRLILLVVLIALIAGSVMTVRARTRSKQKPEIKTAKVERGEIVNTVTATGTLRPLTTVDIKSKAGGLVQVLAVDVGSEVKPGQLIAKIDPTDTLTVMRTAKADLEASNARIRQAQENLKLQKLQTGAQIRQAEESLRAARVRLTQAEKQAKVQPSLTRSNIAQAQASYDSANESLRQLESSTLPQQRASAESSYGQAQADVDVAEKELNRQKDLRARGFIAQSALDTAQNRCVQALAQQTTAKRKLDTLEADQAAQLAGARARVQQARAQLDSARTNAVQDSLKQDEITSARIAVQQAQASLALARANALQAQIRAADIETARAQVTSSTAKFQNATTQYEQTVIVAPRAGIILKKYVEQGTIITAGTSTVAQGTNIVQLGDLSRMFVDVLVDEADIGSVDVGQQVDITVDAFQAELFDGKVIRIDPQAETTQNVTTIKVTVEVDNPDARLKPGMNASCEFVVDRVENVLLVPSEAVKEDDNSQSSVTVLQGDKQVTRKVEVGLTGGDNIEIRSGLKEGEEVVVEVIEPQTTTRSQQRGGMGMMGGPMGGMGGMGRR